MLIVALVGRDERIGRYVSGTQVVPKPTRSVKSRHVGQADSRSDAPLYVLKINKRIVLGGVELHDVTGSERRIQLRIEQAEVGEIREASVAIVDVGCAL